MWGGVQFMTVKGPKPVTDTSMNIKTIIIIIIALSERDRIFDARQINKHFTYMLNSVIS